VRVTSEIASEIKGVIKYVKGKKRKRGIKGICTAHVKLMYAADK